MKEFTAEAAVQLELGHENIAALIGVCFVQKPFLAILEYIMYVETNNNAKQPISGLSRCGSLLCTQSADVRTLLMTSLHSKVW